MTGKIFSPCSHSEGGEELHSIYAQTLEDFSPFLETGFENQEEKLESNSDTRYSSIDGVCNWVLKGNEIGGVNISVSSKRVVFSPD